MPMFPFVTADEPKSQSTVISWKANMDITKTSASRFFNWFSQESDAAGDKVLKVKISY